MTQSQKASYNETSKAKQGKPSRDRKQQRENKRAQLQIATA